MFERTTVNKILYPSTLSENDIKENFMLDNFVSFFDPDGKYHPRSLVQTKIPENAMKTIRALRQTVLGLDGGYKEPFYEDPKVHILTVNGRYLGSSVWNILEQIKGFGYKGIAPILIDSTVELGRLLQVPRVAVIEPFPVMISVLERYGFKKSYIGRSWIFNVDNQPNIPIADYELVVLL